MVRVKSRPARLKSDRPRPAWHAAVFVLGMLILLAVVPYLLLRPRDTTYVLRSAEVAPVTRADVAEVITASGTLSSAQTRAVYAPAGSVLREWLVAEGDSVTQGQALARLDAPELQLKRDDARNTLLDAQDKRDKAVREARAALDSAQDALTQATSDLGQAQQAARLTQELYQAGAASDSERRAAQDKAAAAARAAQVAGRKQTQARQDLAQIGQGAERQVQAAQDDLNRAEAALERLQVRAPIAGRVGTLGTEVGQAAPGTEPLVSVSSLADVQVALELPEELAARVRPGQAARVRTGSQDLAGEVSRVAGSAKAASAQAAPSVAATVRFLQAPRDPRLGGNAEVALTLTTRQGVPSLPRGAFLATGGERLAYVLTGPETAERREVAYGIQSDDRVEVLSGLQSGERVITSSYEAFKDQAVIRVPAGGQRSVP